jgi:4-hydroxybenzoate polyprenyltransferase
VSAARGPEAAGGRAAAAPAAGAGSRARALVELMRIEKPLATAAYALLGAWLGGAGPPAAPRALLAALVVALVTAFGFVINDCRDLAVDRIGKPHRALPSGRVSLPAANRFAWALAAAAAAAGLALGPGPAAVALAALALSAAYSYRLKGTLLLGNAAIAVLVAAVLVFGAQVAGRVTSAVLLAALITLPYIVAQEALFNLEDIDEDRRAGLATTATRLGPEATVRLVRALLVAFVALALLPVPLGRAAPAYLTAAACCAVAPAALLLGLLRGGAGSADRVSRAVRWSRLVWVTSFLPLALLR